MKPNTINWKANKKGKSVFHQDYGENSMKWSFVDIDEHHKVPSLNPSKVNITYCYYFLFIVD